MNQGEHVPQLPLLDDPFDGYFRNGTGYAPEPDSLLDIPAAKRWFEVVGWGSQTDLYSYQQPFESRSGPCVQLNGRRFIMMSSYDYLGLIGHPAIEAAAVQAVQEYGTGTGGVRLLTGTTALHRRFEQELAAFKGTEAAVTFSSGYLANLGVISALFNAQDRVIIDAKAHRSIIDACRLAHVPVWQFKHNDPASLEHVLREKPPGRRTLIAVEGAYSMDGDICPLPEIVDIKKRYGAYLMVDEAHSFGLFGPSGRGIHEHFCLAADEVDIWMGSLSKAIPSNGGFLAGRRDLVIYLQHGAAPFFFSAALCPAAVAAAQASLAVLQREPERLNILWHNAAYLRRGLAEMGYDTGRSSSPIVPVILGRDECAYRMTRALYDLGVATSAVVFPAVPRGSARLRLCATAAQHASTLDAVLHAFRQLREKNPQAANNRPAARDETP